MMRTLQRAEEMRRRFQTPSPLVGEEGAHAEHGKGEGVGAGQCAMRQQPPHLPIAPQWVSSG